MNITSEFFNQFIDIVSNDNYGETVYTTRFKNEGYEIFIKSCCYFVIRDLQNNGFCMDMCSTGLHVWKTE